MEKVRTIREEAFWPLFKQANAQPIEETCIVCHACNASLLVPDDAKNLAREKLQQWTDEGVWSRYPVHGARMEITCPHCEAKTYVTITFLRYHPSDYYPNAKAFVTAFPDEQKQQDFTEKLTKIVNAEARS